MRLPFETTGVFPSLHFWQSQLQAPLPPPAAGRQHWAGVEGNDCTFRAPPAVRTSRGPQQPPWPVVQTGHPPPLTGCVSVVARPPGPCGRNCPHYHCSKMKLGGAAAEATRPASRFHRHWGAAAGEYTGTLLTMKRRTRKEILTMPPPRTAGRFADFPLQDQLVRPRLRQPVRDPTHAVA